MAEWTDVRFVIAEDPDGVHAPPLREFTASKVVGVDGDHSVTTYPLNEYDQAHLRKRLNATLPSRDLRVWIEGQRYRYVHDTLKIDQEGIAVFDVRP